MKAYVINMASRPDRLAGFRHEAERAGIEYEVFEAITPEHVAIPDTFICGRVLQRAFPSSYLGKATRFRR
jgi:GR25 family glycosyltransferase involved in LPS biosynthesis